MKLKYLMPLMIFIVMAALLYMGLNLNPRDIPSTMIGKPAPDFSLPLLNNPEHSFSPASLKGQRWILNVWASWCVSCRYEHPLFNEIAANTRIPIIGLNHKDQAQDAKQWLANRGNPYQYIPTDMDGRVSIDWGVYGVPETFVIDESGHVIYKHTGPIDTNILRLELAPLFPELQALLNKQQ